MLQIVVPGDISVEISQIDYIENDNGNLQSLLSKVLGFDNIISIIYYIEKET